MDSIAYDSVYLSSGQTSKLRNSDGMQTPWISPLETFIKYQVKMSSHMSMDF